MIVKLRLIVERQARKRASRKRTLPCVMSNILAMLTIEDYFLVEAILELWRSWAILRWLGKGSKTLCSIVPCIVEENLFVQVFSSCHIEHALGQALELLLKFLFPIMVILGRTRDIMISERFEYSTCVSQEVDALMFLVFRVLSSSSIASKANSSS